MNTKKILRTHKISFLTLPCLALNIMNADASLSQGEYNNMAVRRDKSENMLVVHAGETKDINGDVNDVTVSDGYLSINPATSVRGNVDVYGASAKVNINGSAIEGNVTVHPLEEHMPHTLTRILNIKETDITGNSRVPVIQIKESCARITHSRIENKTGAGMVFLNSTLDNTLPPSAIKIDNSVISSGYDSAIKTMGLGIEINHSKINAYNEDTISTGIHLSPADIANGKKSAALIRNSKIDSNGNGAYIVGSNAHIYNSTINSSNYSGVVLNGGTLIISNDSVIQASGDYPGLALINEHAGKYTSNDVVIDNATVYSKYDAAIAIYASDPHASNDINFGSDSSTNAFAMESDSESLRSFSSDISDEIASDYMDHSTTITLRNNAKIISDNNFIAHSMSHLPVKMRLVNSNIAGCVKSDPGADFSLYLDQNSFFDGYTKDITSIDLTEDAAWHITQNSDVENVNNAGSILLSTGQSVGSELLVHNDYIGGNGLLTFNVTLAGDISETDKLTVLGNTSGITHVQINNIGGTGDSTVNGIELITVRGLSDGTFKQSGRIVAGAYDYHLVRGKEEQSKNWYLTSQLSTIKKITRITPVDQPIGHPEAVSYVKQEEAASYIERPEAASYISNLSTANKLFITTMHDRAARTQYPNRVSDKNKMSSLWLRQLGNHNTWHDGHGQLKTKSTSYVTQLGGDLAQWSFDNISHGRLGLMVGYGKSQSRTLSSVTDYHSKGSISGYSIGGYSTWLTNDIDKSGLYIDSWLQYNWFNNQVNGQGLAKEHYKSKGINASIEAGYAIRAARLINAPDEYTEWMIQPQAQATLMNVKAQEHRETNNTLVISRGQGNIETRLGVRAYREIHHGMGKDERHELVPFIETNWIHNTRNFSVNMDSNNITQAGTRDTGEVKIGITGKINSKITLDGHINTQIGNNGYHSMATILGITYSF